MIGRGWKHSSWRCENKRQAIRVKLIACLLHFEVAVRNHDMERNSMIDKAVYSRCRVSAESLLEHF